MAKMSRGEKEINRVARLMIRDAFPPKAKPTPRKFRRDGRQIINPDFYRRTR